MNIRRAHSMVKQIFRKFFRHFLCQSGDQHTLIALHANLNFLHQIVNGAIVRANFNGRVKKSRWANHLVNDNTLTLLQFILSGRSTDVNHLLRQLLKFIKSQRAIV